ncbi:MAG: hypothetical protein U9O96_07045 [Candidatus Thermoplasmatota archaeon]|nr:hypothetical protein [Candidatus Thermoplasmatota archaeon]
MKKIIATAVSFVILLGAISITGEEKFEREENATFSLPNALCCDGPDDIDDAAHFKYYQNDSNIVNWYEWWYMNVKGDDGNNLLIEFFTFGDLNNPFASAVGIVMIFMKEDGSIFKSLKSYPFIDYNLDYEKCNVTIAGDVFYESGKENYTITYHNGISDASLYLNVSGITCGVTAIPTDMGGEEWMRWTIPAPCGKTDGVLEYTDKEGRHVYKISGKGYHDHNWGISRKLSMDWEWGEFSDDSIPASVVYGMAKFGDKPFEGGIYFSNETVSKAIHMPDLKLEYLEWDVICGFKKPTRLRLYGSNGSFSADVTVEVEQIYIIGVYNIGTPYLMGKMSGAIIVDGKDYKFSNVTGFYEHHFLNPFG